MIQLSVYGCENIAMVSIAKMQDQKYELSSSKMNFTFSSF